MALWRFPPLPRRRMEFARDFWIGQPFVLESEIGFPNQAPAFCPCPNRMMTVPLDLAEFHDDRGIRHHSLKVTTISAIMGEISKGNANLAQLAVQGNYRAGAAQDMEKVYSRNLAQRQIFVAICAQKSAPGKQRRRVYRRGPIGIFGGMSSGQSTIGQGI